MSEQELMSLIPLLIPLFLIQIILLIVALVKWVKKKKLPNRMVWLVVIIFVNIFGALVFLIYSSGKGEDDEE